MIFSSEFDTVIEEIQIVNSNTMQQPKYTGKDRLTKLFYCVFDQIYWFQLIEIPLTIFKL